MNDPIIVRRARASDSLKLSILCKTAYIQTYGTEGVSDEFANFIDVRFAPSNLERTIVSNANSIAVAEFNGSPVGVVEIVYGTTCPIGNSVAPELNKLYVLDRFYGKGAGCKLLNMSEAMVGEQGAAGCGSGCSVPTRGPSPSMRGRTMNGSATLHFKWKRTSTTIRSWSSSFLPIAADVVSRSFTFLDP